MTSALPAIDAPLRGRLHRYCARMAGSAADGEDLVQDTLLRAFEAYPATQVEALEPWLFGIAHHAALDLHRRRARMAEAVDADAELESLADPAPGAEVHAMAAASLPQFMQLPPVQRSSVILVDVLGYALREVASLHGSTLEAVKSALHRGRRRLMEQAHSAPAAPSRRLSEAEHARLAAYVERFNARDFDAVRDMLAHDVRCDVAARTQLLGKSAVSTYFGNYRSLADWRLRVGWVDGAPAVLVTAPGASAAVEYFITLEWRDGEVVRIRDFRHARYVMQSAEVATA